MPKFKVGDRVEREGLLVPSYMRWGTITLIIPNDGDLDWLTEYKVDFGDHMVETYYETQLRLAEERDTL